MEVEKVENLVEVNLVEVGKVMVEEGTAVEPKEMAKEEEEARVVKAEEKDMELQVHLFRILGEGGEVTLDKHPEQTSRFLFQTICRVVADSAQRSCKKRDFHRCG